MNFTEDGIFFKHNFKISDQIGNFVLLQLYPTLQWNYRIWNLPLISLYSFIYIMKCYQVWGGNWTETETYFSTNFQCWILCRFQLTLLLIQCYEVQLEKVSWHALKLHIVRTDFIGRSSTDMHVIWNQLIKYNSIGETRRGLVASQWRDRQFESA